MSAKAATVSAQERADRFAAQLFGVRRSMRYNTERRRFFESLHRMTAVFSLFAASGVVAAVLASQKSWGVAAAVIIALLQAFDLTVGFTNRARQHERFAQQYCELEEEMERVGPSGLEEFKRRRSKIENDEPPVLHVLNSIAHNEVMRATGYSVDDPHMIVVSPWQRRLRHLFDFRQHALRPRGIPPPKKESKRFRTSGDVRHPLPLTPGA